MLKALNDTFTFLDQAYSNTTRSKPSNKICTEDAGEFWPLHRTLLGIITVILLLFGTAGNMATFCVFKQRVYQKNTMSVMFRYLSVLDTIFLWTVVLQLFIKAVSGRHIAERVSRLCLLNIYWSQVLTSLANWMLVVITIARLVHLKFPTKTRDICSKFNYYCGMILSHIYVICIHAGIMLAIESRLTRADYRSDKPCYDFMVRQRINHDIDRYVYAFTNFIGPAALLIMCNTLIVIELRQLRRRRERLFNQAITSTAIEHTTESITRPHPTISSNSGHDASHNAFPRDSSRNSTRTNDDNHNVLPRDPSRNYSLKNVSGCGDTSLVELREMLQSECSNSLTACDGTRDGIAVKDVIVELMSATSFDYNLNHLDVLRPKKKRESNVDMLSVNHGSNYGDGTSTTLSTKSKVSWFSQARSNPVDMGFEDEPMDSERLSPLKKHTGGERGIDTSDTKHAYSKTYSKRTYSKDSRTETLTRMLIAASSVFILLNLPFWVAYLEFLKHVTHNPDTKCSYRAMLADLSLTVKFSNNSINFIFYCAVGSRFRKESHAWLRSLFRQ